MKNQQDVIWSSAKEKSSLTKKWLIKQYKHYYKHIPIKLTKTNKR